MVVVEKVTKVLFMALFGWVIVMLAAETVVRRKKAARRKAALEQALVRHPQLRPTAEYQAPNRGPSTRPSQA